MDFTSLTYMGDVLFWFFMNLWGFFIPSLLLFLFVSLFVRMLINGIKGVTGMKL
jgi:hypothetical protein